MADDGNTWKILATNHSCIHKCKPCIEEKCFLRLNPDTETDEIGVVK